jgi:hypothetical protein
MHGNLLHLSQLNNEPDVDDGITWTIASLNNGQQCRQLSKTLSFEHSHIICLSLVVRSSR